MKRVPGHPDYHIDTCGNVFSEKTGKFRKPSFVDGKYATMLLYECGRQVRVLVHRLVLETYRGPCPTGMEACHNNGNTRDNCLSNLRWDTPAENALDRVRHGTSGRGESRKYSDGHFARRSKLTPSVVMMIRELLLLRLATIKDIASIFGMKCCSIYAIQKADAAWSEFHPTS